MSSLRYIAASGILILCTIQKVHSQFDANGTASSRCTAVLSDLDYITTCGPFGRNGASFQTFNCPKNAFINQMSGKKSSYYLAAIRFNCSDGTQSPLFDSGQTIMTSWTGPVMSQPIDYVFVRSGAIIDGIQYSIDQPLAGGTGGTPFHAKDNRTGCPLTGIIIDVSGAIKLDMTSFLAIKTISLIFKCPVCPRGQQLSAQKTSCEPCPIGSFKPIRSDGLADCSICNSTQNQVCPFAGMSSFMCEPGYILLNETCRPCPIGTYKSLVNASQCTWCQSPQTCPNTAMSQFWCIPGYFVINGKCSECPKGTFKSEAGASACTTCAYPKVCPNTGMTQFYCEPGFFIDNQEYKQCDFGTYKPSTGNGSCIPCVDPEFCPSPGMADFTCKAGYELQSGTCQRCKSGFFKSAYDSSLCRSCPSNSQCVNGTEYRCLPGFEPNVANGSCTPCISGYYKSQLDNTQCQKCPANSNCSSTAFQCMAGYEYHQNADGPCQACQSGHYKPMAGNRRRCRPCPSNSNCTATTFHCNVGANFTGSQCVLAHEASQASFPVVTAFLGVLALFIFLDLLMFAYIRLKRRQLKSEKIYDPSDMHDDIDAADQTEMADMSATHFIQVQRQNPS